MSNNPARLQYTQTGEGPDLVLLHGWGLNSGIFADVAAALAHTHRVTLLDLPGHGINAGILPEHYNLAQITAMVQQVLPASATVVGWSLGGLVAQQLALSWPQQVQRLILVATSAKFMASEPDASRSDISETWFGIKPGVLDNFKALLQQDFAQLLDRFMAIQAMGSRTARQDIKRIRAMVADFPLPATTALQGGLDILSDVDLREQVASIAAPTLRLYGRLDSLVPHKAHAPIGTCQPNAQTQVLEKASHAPFISHPEDFLNIINAFLNDETPS